MDNSMIEYKKKSKFADMIDSLKFNAKILFAGKNQEKIKSAIMDRNEENRLESLGKCASNLIGENIFSIIETLSEEDRIEALDKYVETLSDYAISNIIDNLSEPNKLKNLEKYIEKMGSYNLSNIIYNMDSSNKLEAFKLAVDKINGRDIEELLTGVFEGNDNIEIIRLSKDKLTKENITNIINQTNSSQQIEVVTIFQEKLGSKEAKEIISNLDSVNKSNAIELLKNKLEGKDIIDILNGMSNSAQKAEILENCRGKLYDVDVIPVVRTLDDVDKKHLIDMYLEYNFDDVAINTIKTFDSEIKKEIIKEKEGRLSPNSFNKLIDSFDLEDKKELLSLYSSRMTKEGLRDTIMSFDASDKLVLLEQYNEELYDLYICNIIESFEDDIKKDLLDKYADRLNGSEIYQVIRTFDSNQRLELLFEYMPKLNDNVIKEEIFNLDENDKIEGIRRFRDKLNEKDLEIIIGSFDNQDIIKNLIEEYDVCKDLDIDIVSQYMSKLDARILNERSLLTNEAVELIGEKEHYQLVKYIVVPKDKEGLDISNAIDNPENFKAYLQLREYFNKQGLAVQNLANGIQEYSIHSEIINDMLSQEEVDSRQIDILEQLVKNEPYEEIKTAGDLEKYPQLRKERFDKRIKDNSKECTYEMLLGMTSQEFEDVSATFAKGKDLSLELSELTENVPEDARENLIEIIAMLKVVEMVNDMPEEQRQETLNGFNQSLLDEFSIGSRVADIRYSMSGLRKNVRGIFGKELSQSLDVKTNEETKIEIIQEDGNDNIEVVHLEGEEFKILIHAVDAYGSGNGHFENREIGRTQICTSLISDKFMGRANGSPIVAFTDFEAEALIQEGSANIFSNAGQRDSNTLNVTAGGKNGFRRSDKLIEETVKNREQYNEVNLYREYMNKDGEIKSVMPSHIVCFDEIDELSKQEARLIAEKFGLEKPLPILVIHTEKYKDRIEEYAKEVRGENQAEIQQEVIEEKIEGKTISERVEEIMEIAEEKADPREIAKAQVEMINSQEQTQGYKKPTAMMSKDDGFEH